MTPSERCPACLGISIHPTGVRNLTKDEAARIDAHHALLATSEASLKEERELRIEAVRLLRRMVEHDRTLDGERCVYCDDGEAFLLRQKKEVP